jgi:hypothetical protein
MRDFKNTFPSKTHTILTAHMVEDEHKKGQKPPLSVYGNHFDNVGSKSADGSTPTVPQQARLGKAG